jgi:hypothetical protein
MLAWQIVLIASVAMVAQDILGTILVMAEANERGWLAGWCDAAAWCVSITTATLSITAFQGHDWPLKIGIVVGVSIANVGGTKVGQIIGSHLMTSVKMRTLFAKGDVPVLTIKERVALLERRNP